MNNISPAIVTYDDTQLSERTKSIGASEIGRIIKGEWAELYEIKTGQMPAPDLSNVFPVQLGLQTEKFNLAWRMYKNPELFSEADLTRNHEILADDPNQSIRHAKYHFLSATPDAWCTIDGMMGVMDCKHTHPNAWPASKYDSKEDRVLDTYKYQMTQQMMVTDTRISMISPIYGNTWGEPIIFKYDQEIADLIVEQASAFWQHIELKCAPVDQTPIEQEVIPVDKRRGVSEDEMKATNFYGDWCDNAIVIKSFTDNKKLYDASIKNLKKLMPIDAHTCTAGGVTLKRSKSNAISVRVL